MPECLICNLSRPKSEKSTGPKFHPTFNPFRAFSTETNDSEGKPRFPPRKKCELPCLIISSCKLRTVLNCNVKKLSQYAFVKGAAVVLALLTASPALADDVASARRTFEAYTDYQQQSDKRILDQLTPACSAAIVETDGKVEITTPLSSDQFRAGIRSALAAKSKTPGTYEDVAYTASDKEISAKGTLHIPQSGAQRDFKGPFSVVFKKDEAGEVRINYLRLTVPIPDTPVTCHSLFSFSMPGAWKANDLPKSQRGNSEEVHAGNASMGGSAMLLYMAFEDATKSPSDQSLENYPSAAAAPIVEQLEKGGATLESRDFQPISSSDKNRSYFSVVMKSPSGERAYLSGVVIRTGMRIYVIQEVSGRILNRSTWEEIARSFKEL